MTAAAFFIICATAGALIAAGTDALYLQRRGGPHTPSLKPLYQAEERAVVDAKKRPFCNAFTGCGRKRSNLPALSDRGQIIDESIGSLLELSAEPAVEDLSRQIMSEAKLWEAIQEANMELNRRRHDSDESSEDDAAVPARSAAASCALPPCYI